MLEWTQELIYTFKAKNEIGVKTLMLQKKKHINKFSNSRGAT